MDASMRFFATVLLGAVGLTLVVFRPDWLRALGIEPASFDRGRNSTSLSDPPPEVAALASRFAAKTRVAARLVARELDLFEAAAHFRSFNQLPPAYVQPASRIPGETDEENLCRQVIRWVEVHGRNHLPRREIDELVAELEAILAARSCEEGRFELPELR